MTLLQTLKKFAASAPKSMLELRKSFDESQNQISAIERDRADYEAQIRPVLIKGTHTEIAAVDAELAKIDAQLERERRRSAALQDEMAALQEKEAADALAAEIAEIQQEVAALVPEYQRVAELGAQIKAIADRAEAASRRVNAFNRKKPPGVDGIVFTPEAMRTVPARPRVVEQVEITIPPIHEAGVGASMLGDVTAEHFKPQKKIVDRVVDYGMSAHHPQPLWLETQIPNIDPGKPYILRLRRV
jgi:hypothetical protein